MNSEERSPSTVKDHMSWNTVDCLLAGIYNAVKDLNIRYVYGIPRGGLIPAVWLSHKLNAKLILRLYDYYAGESWNDLLIIEDVIDTGNSIRGFQKFHPKMNIVSLVRKPWAPKVLYSAHETEKWVVLPWEN